MNRPFRRRGFFSHGGDRGNRDSRRAPQEGSLLCVKREYLTQRHEGAKQEKLASRFRGNDGGGGGAGNACRWGGPGAPGVWCTHPAASPTRRPTHGPPPPQQAAAWIPQPPNERTA